MIAESLAEWEANPVIVNFGLKSVPISDIQVGGWNGFRVRLLVNGVGTYELVANLDCRRDFGSFH